MRKRASKFLSLSVVTAISLLFAPALTSAAQADTAPFIPARTHVIPSTRTATCSSSSDCTAPSRGNDVRIQVRSHADVSAFTELWTTLSLNSNLNPGDTFACGSGEVSGATFTPPLFTQNFGRVFPNRTNDPALSALADGHGDIHCWAVTPGLTMSVSNVSVVYVTI